MTLSAAQTLAAYVNELELKSPATHIDLTLTRLQPILEKLGLVRWPCKVIMVAGTNGKGSVVATCQALAKAAGIRLAAYTSPHLHRIHERFCFDGTLITDEQLVTHLKTVHTLSQTVPLTQFEQLTLVALLFFKNCQPDGLVLEVGMGGEFDAVNCVEADVSVVTSIDYDHQQWLGPTLAHIARAKAGIFRPGQHAVISQHAAHPVILETASRVGVLLHLENDNWIGEAITGKPAWLEPHNAAVAIKAMQLAWPDRFRTAEIVTAGLRHTQLPGRLEILCEQPLIVVDVAHNVQGARRLAQWCQSHPVSGKRHVLWASLKDKDMTGMVRALKNEQDHWWIAPCTVKPNLRAASVIGLEAVALACGLTYTTADTPEQAFTQALAALRPADRLVVFGNFEWVGQFRQSILGKRFSDLGIWPRSLEDLCVTELAAQSQSGFSEGSSEDARGLFEQ